jgi:hypothetical protein
MNESVERNFSAVFCGSYEMRFGLVSLEQGEVMNVTY